MDRKKWFEKVAWSYVPCSTEGFVWTGCVVVVFFLVLFATGGLDSSSTAGPFEWTIRVLSFFALWFVSIKVAERRS